ncbi:MAG TPA: molybdenum cofactor guanylyltransferase [Ktedonobacterales bacterium]|jgi:molybdopterin-guanine dinucleotide biosynthesis protein A|nr:molybdenum cofactor guanylyltransferase [Ktedonobacterales bacterium]
MSADGMQNASKTLQENSIGVVLAGGRSQRMGDDKAALTIGGEPLLRRVVRRLEAALPHVLVIGPETLQPLAPHARVVPDGTPGRGPLGGIVTAFAIFPTRLLFVVACDMPFVQPALVRELVRVAVETPDVDVVTLRSQRGFEPLHAVYRPSSLPAMHTRLASGDGALHSLLQQLRVREVPRGELAHFDPAGLSAFNANTPDEWQRALELAAGEI